MEVDSNKILSFSTNPKENVAYEFPGLIRVFTNGAHVQRLTGTDVVSPSIDPHSPVSSKDVTITTHLESNSTITARLFLPQPPPSNRHNHNHKLPLLVYFHGGGFFCASSPFTATYHNYLTTLVSESKVVAVSVDYRLAPEHPIPAAYEDSWAALQWVASHRNNNGPEPWLNEHADFSRVFLAGDSAGANIVHNVAMFAGDSDSGLQMDILGACLVHPYFWGNGPVGSEVLDPVMSGLWPFLCPSTPDNDDPRVNPVADGAPELTWLGCRRVLVCVAEKDVLRERGWVYFNALSRSGWLGVVEIEETQGEGHAFHLHDLGCDKAKDLIKSLAEFFNRDPPASI